MSKNTSNVDDTANSSDDGPVNGAGSCTAAEVTAVSAAVSSVAAAGEDELVISAFVFVFVFVEGVLVFKFLWKRERMS